MALTPEEAAALNRLATGYNGNAYDAQGNPLGFARGGNQLGNFIAALRDESIVGRLVSRSATDNEKLLADLKAAVEAAKSGPVQSVAGFAGIVTAEQIANALDLPAVRPAAVIQPAAGTTASLTGGALTVAVAGFYSDYGKRQQAIRIQIDNDPAFASPEVDQITQTQATSVSIPNAQAIFTGGTTYYARSQQTDEDGKVGAWSGPTAFTFPRLPVAPVMSAPANGANNVGAQNQAVTFTASAYSHPNGTAQAARRFEVSKDNFATIVTVNGTVGQASATLSNPQSSLTANTAYKVRAVDTDANGGVSTGAATSFTMVAQYLANEGEPSDGGNMGFRYYGDGPLNHLILASKSTDAGRNWNAGSTTLIGAYSRLNGPANTALATSGGAQQYAASISIGGVAGYLWAIDEARAIASKLKPSVATVAAFQAGGSEVFSTSPYWSSTEIDASNARISDMTAGSDVSSSKNSSGYLVRAIKRVAASMPYPIGTYDASWGGYLAAYFTDMSSGSPQLFMLIVADKATEVTRAWGSAGSSSNNRLTRTNGVAATASIVQFEGASSAAGYCDGLVSGGQSDWYLGAIDEMRACIRMNASLPSAQQFTAFGGSVNGYWSSTEIDASTAKVALWSDASEVSLSKANPYIVRPIRRIPITI